MEHEVWSPVLLSLQVSCSAVVIMLLPAFLLACATHREGWLPSFIDSAVQVPLVLPPVVVGYALLWVAGPNSPCGQFFRSIFKTDLAFSFWAAVLAGSIVGMPFLVKSLQQSLQSMPKEALFVVYGLGLPPKQARLLTRFLYAVPGCGQGSLLAFSRSFGEFGATMIFASNIPGETRTVPLAIYTVSESLDTSGTAGILCLISVIIAFGAVGIVRMMERKRRGPL